jgi:hypothetical protein
MSTATCCRGEWGRACSASSRIWHWHIPYPASRVLFGCTSQLPGRASNRTASPRASIGGRRAGRGARRWRWANCSKRGVGGLEQLEHQSVDALRTLHCTSPLHRRFCGTTASCTTGHDTPAYCLSISLFRPPPDYYWLYWALMPRQPSLRQHSLLATAATKTLPLSVTRHSANQSWSLTMYFSTACDSLYTRNSSW